MRLQELDIRAFKGCAELLVESKGQNLWIYGDNGTGKTTIADSLNWLLFNKDSQGRANFEIKTLDKNGKSIKGLAHSVYASFVLDDGSEVSFEKSYKEVWTKKRGSSQAEFSGNTNDYKVNRVPVQENEFNAQVAQICDQSKFRLLTDPTFFNESLSWQDRRKALIEVCGDVTNEEVIAKNKELEGVPAILGKHSIDDYKRILVATRKETNATIGDIPTRIDELNRNLPSEDIFGAGDPGVFREKLAKYQSEKALLLNGGAVAEKTIALREVESQIITEDNKLREQANSGTFELQNELMKLKSKISDLKLEGRNLGAENEDSKKRVTRLEEELQGLRNELKDIHARTFEFSGKDSCAACGQSLPAEEVEAAKQKALEDFNTKKATALERNMSLGKEAKAKHFELAAVIEGNNLKIAELAETLAGLDEERRSLEEKIAEVKPVHSSDTRDKLTVKKAEIELEINKLKEGMNADLSKIEEDIKAAQDAINESEREKVRQDQRASGLKRIEQLEAQERELAKEIERIDGELFLLEKFTKTKVSMLEESINSRFELAMFKLFNTNVNGGVVEVCETTFEGVPYGSLNHGSRINVGLDIINVLADYHGFHPFVLIDNAESVTNILPTKGQQIQLVVSERDKSLRFAFEPDITSPYLEAQRVAQEIEARQERLAI